MTKILYTGSFLREGFEISGCDIVPLDLDGTRTLNEIIESTCPDADFVFIEFFGKRTLPKEIHACRYPVCAYCIDSLINEFWFADIATLFDVVFVDQKTSLRPLHARGVDAVWLPLCVPSSAFRYESDKEHFITFVGLTTIYRKKRSNLLELIRKHFDINIMSGITSDAMQTVFSKSHIVLNENLFSGLTLRVFQALASGSLLLTEAGGYGVDTFFTPDEHLVCYSPDTLLPLLDTMRRNISAWKHVAIHGQQCCLQHHQSVHRAKTVLALVAGMQSGTRTRRDQKHRLAEARGKYYHARRFGGSYQESIVLLQPLKGLHTSTGCRAAFLLGSIYAHRADLQKARPLLAHGSFGNDLVALLASIKLMVTYMHDDTRSSWLDVVLKKAIDVGIDINTLSEHILRIKHTRSFEHDVYLLFSAILYEAKNILELGFLEQDLDPFPETAFDYAVLAYKTCRSEASLDALIRCARCKNVELEILPFLEDAILTGVARDDHILYAAELYKNSYAFHHAHTVLKSMKK